MRQKYKVLNQEGLHLISLAVVHWIDVFIRDEYRNLLLVSWRYCMKEKGLEVWDAIL
ncbi:MAG: hypothetical protein WD077_12725 [Bacteroidia bacterium]